MRFIVEGRSKNNTARKRERDRKEPEIKESEKYRITGRREGERKNKKK